MSKKLQSNGGHVKEIDNNVATEIMAGFEKLPDKPLVTLLKNEARRYIGRIETGDEVPEDALFFAGVNLAYAKGTMGRLPNATQMGKGVLVENSYGWKIETFAQTALPAYVEGFEQARIIVPANVQALTGELYPYWFKSRFGLDYSEERLKVILQPTPVLFPFDHYTDERNFIGNVARYPKEYERRAFRYMKGWDFPPVMWYSDRSENDFLSYMNRTAFVNGMTVAQAVKQAGTHEAVHLLAVDPLVELAMRGNKHCWFTEGIAQYYGDTYTRDLNVSRLSEIPNITDLANNEGKPVNYHASVLLTMAIGARKAGSIADLETGIQHTLITVAKHAKAVQEGNATKVASTLELLWLVDPELANESEQQKTTKLMQEIVASIKS